MIEVTTAEFPPDRASPRESSFQSNFGPTVRLKSEIHWTPENSSVWRVVAYRTACIPFWLVGRVWMERDESSDFEGCGPPGDLRRQQGYT
jgi:hypothetical protein